nr:RNA-dependent RNA polymerase, eukaryotic-type [Tanacetum cinerariifolium]
MNCAKDVKVIDIDDQLLMLIKRQLETESMLEEMFRDLCEEVSNFVNLIQNEVKDVERLSCKDVAKETVRLLRSVKQHEFFKMTCLQRRKLEDVVSVQDAINIISMKTGSVFDFEAKNLAKYGRANCEPSDRVM